MHLSRSKLVRTGVRTNTEAALKAGISYLVQSFFPLIQASFRGWLAGARNIPGPRNAGVTRRLFCILQEMQSSISAGILRSLNVIQKRHNCSLNCFYLH